MAKIAILAIHLGAKKTKNKAIQRLKSKFEPFIASLKETPSDPEVKADCD